MKQIQINYIHYKNFKGLTDFKLELDGKDAIVSARNKTGKTTLYDGFYWLLFDKNSQEQAQFRIKPFDTHGEDVLGTDTSIEAELVIDGERVLLKKELLEKWTHPKNSLEKIRGKDVKKYFINGIPTKTKKEYTDFISTLIDEQSFKLLTNPAFFATKGWDERRKILLGLVDEVSVEEVVKVDPDFQSLVEPLQKSSLEELKDGWKYEMKELQKQEKDLSTRLDEVSKNIPTQMESKDNLDRNLEEIEAKITNLQNEQAEIMNGGAVAKLKREMEAVESTIHEERMKFSHTNQLTVVNLQNDLNDLTSRYRTERDQLFEISMKIERLNKKIEIDQEEKDTLLKEYHLENERTFEEHSKTCSTCGQELPEGQIDTLLIAFNTNKSNRLTEIKEKGSKAKNDIELGIEQVKELQEMAKDCSQKIGELEKHGKECKKELERVIAENSSFEESEKYEILTEKGFDIQAKITEEHDSKQSMIAGIQDDLALLAKQKQEWSEKLSAVRQAEQQKLRMNELIDQRKEILDLFNQTHGQLFLAEEFFKTKIRLQEEKVNSLFEITTFVFFGTNENGEEKEICSITVDGSDYHTNLNNASKINSGLDIIHTLSKAYNLAAPIFIDNAEGVNDLFETDSQMISLLVSNDTSFKVAVK